jgi:hypothetical protein
MKSEEWRVLEKVAVPCFFNETQLFFGLIREVMNVV